MRSRYRVIAGKLVRVVPAGLMGWALIGCDAPPDIMPIAPPGVAVPRKAPEEEPAQAQGEMAAPALADYDPAHEGRGVHAGPPDRQGRDQDHTRAA